MNNKDNKSPELSEEKKKLLKDYHDLLPDGAISEITRRLKGQYSQTYVSRFFHGDYFVTLENSKILDLGIEIMEESKNKQENEKQKKEVSILNQKLSQAKNLTPETEF